MLWLWQGAPDCPEPRDEARIAKNRAAFQKANPYPRSGSNRGPQHKTSSDGKPLIQNKVGAYVLDQKQIQKEKEAIDLLKMLSESSSESVPPNQSLLVLQLPLPMSLRLRVHDKLNAKLP